MKVEKTHKVLIIADHRKDRSPNQRFRIEQYITYLSENGFECELSPLLDANDDKVFYTPGSILKKIGIVLKSIRKRKQDLYNIEKYSLVFLVRQSLLTRGTWFEKTVKDKNIPIIFDFDDAIWLSDVSNANRAFFWLKDPSKIETSIRLSSLIFAGNEYLADYARQFNKRISVIPTTIDTTEYKPVEKRQSQKLTIGWSGSLTTIKHFEYAIPFLLKIKAEFGDLIQIKVIGDANYRNEELGIVGQAWKKDTEVPDLCEFDIGIMPLPDDKWAKGKCGLKGLQYMALGIPTIMSPVGVNSTIINQGENGFLASDETQWIIYLRDLLTDPELRRTVGLKARQTVEKKYSTQVWKETYLETFRKLVNEKI
jgi:glycosyltransferase involved in cell wall biosynthesis